MKSKNVLIVIPHLGVGGTEIQTLNTVGALVLGGYKVSVLCLFRHVETMVSKYETAGAVVYCACPQYNRYGIDIDYPKHLKLFLFLYKHLKEVIKRAEIDIVHVQYMSPASSVILVLRFLLFQRNIIVTSHTMADIYKNLSLVHFIQRHCVRAFTCITERAERSFFGTSQLYSKDMVLGKRNHFTIYNALPFRQQVNCDDSQVNAASPRLNAAEQRLIATGSQVNVAEQRLKETQSQGDDSPATALRLTSSSAAINRSEAASHDEDEDERLNAAEQQVNSDGSQVNAPCAVNVASPRLNAAEQRLIATASQVNVAEQRLNDTQSQGDDSPATPLRLTSSSAAINRSEADPRSPLTLNLSPRQQNVPMRQVGRAQRRVWI